MFMFPVLAACASSGPRAEVASPGTPADGMYDYVANLPGQEVRGRLHVVADTITVEPVSDYCRPTVRAPDPLAFHYSCNGPGTYESMQLRIDRRNPVQLSKWTAAFRVQRQRRVCVRYEVQNGRRVCVQMETETYETTESRSGNLQVRRITGTEIPR